MARNHCWGFNHLRFPILPELTAIFQSPQASSTVGPFQDLNQLGQDHNREVFLQLWPHDRSRQLDVAALRLDRPQPQLDDQEKAVGETYWDEL